MILYTIQPIEAILNEDADVKTKEYKSFSNGILETVNINGKSVINRVISTDLKAYLNDKYSPGTVIKG